MFARFDEIPTMTLQDIKKKKLWRDRCMDGCTEGGSPRCMDKVKTVYPHKHSLKVKK